MVVSLISSVKIGVRQAIKARVAELADALDSKSSVRKNVWVRVPPLVLKTVVTFASNSKEPG